MAAAETGSGKTGAFALPLLQITHETLRQHAMQQPSEPAPELGYYEILNCERDATPVVRESGPRPALAPPTSPPPALTARAAPFRGRQTIKKQYYQLAKVRLRAGPRLRLRLLNASDAGDSRHVPS